jgi:hypothetical protein
MATPLRPEVLPPAPSGRFFRTILLCDVLALFAISAWNASYLHVRSPTTVIAAQEARVVAASVPGTAPQAQGTSELLFVFRAGGATYVRLADGADELPAHGTPQFFDDDDGTAVIAPIADADVPGRYRRYRGARFRVDQGCEASVRGFAIVARLVGDPGYAGIEDAAWTTRSVMRHGATFVAARIDGCATGTYGRDARLPKILTPDELTDDELVDVARRALLASGAAAEAQVAWRSAAMPGRWYDHVDLDVKVMRHPTTGITWVTVHASYVERDCAGPDVNLWGLFAVSRTGALEAVAVRKLDSIYSIDAVVDVEGDGDLELVGRSWLGLETILVDAKDEREIDRLRFPFFDCPC